MFEFQQYYTAFLKFLDDMNRLKSEIAPSIQNILESLCTLIDKSFMPELHDIGNITAKSNLAQGFYFDKPLPCKIFETKL